MRNFIRFFVIVATIAYVIVFLGNFLSWDLCWFKSRTENSPEINWYLVILGSIGQISHFVLVFLFSKTILSKKTFDELIDSFPMGLLVAIIFTLTMSGSVQHGLLAGDKLKPSITNDRCWKLCLNN
ncbi:hypothetical protein [Undibacterium pigrum]|uniref:hypothetical protein n=1 Tax=Undibacterium pigrum TaxID=401470 RepID=UPI000D768F7A|nr:hypothetical protein [Undibacterium pigrum]